MDVKKFNVALSETLSSPLLLAARSVRPDTPDAPWKVRLLFTSPLARANHRIQIRLTNSGVPVSFIDSGADTRTMQPVPKGADPHEGVLAHAIGIRELLGRLKNPRFIIDMAAGRGDVDPGWRRGRDHCLN